MDDYLKQVMREFDEWFKPLSVETKDYVLDGVRSAEMKMRIAHAIILYQAKVREMVREEGIGWEDDGVHCVIINILRDPLLTPPVKE